MSRQTAAPPIKTKVDIRSYLTIGFAAVFLLLLAVAVLSYRNAQNLIEASALVTHSDRVISELQSTRATMNQLAAVQHDSYFAKSGKHTNAYHVGVASLKQHVQSLRQMVTDNPEQQARIGQLEQAIDTKLLADEQQGQALLGGGQALPEDEFRTAQAERMQRILSALDTMQSEEERLLHERTRHADSVATVTLRLITVLSLAAFLVILVSGLLLTHNLRARAQIQRELAESESRYQDLFDGASELIHVLSPAGWFLYANVAWQRTLGYSPEEILCLRLADVVHPDDLPAAQETFRRLLGGEVLNQVDLRLKGKNGSIIPVIGTASCRFLNGKPASIRGIYRDVTEQRRTEDELRNAQRQLQVAFQKEKELARLDTLTGLPNRQAFLEALDAERARSLRYGRLVTISYVNMEGFKKLNHSMGRNEGDALLASIGLTLRTSLRASDFVFRTGGDEFAIVLPETDVRASRSVLEKLQSRLIASVEAGNWPIEFNIRAATFAKPPQSLEAMMKVAHTTISAIHSVEKNAVSVALVSADAQA